MLDLEWLEKCFEEWLKQNPGGTWDEFMNLVYKYGTVKRKPYEPKIMYEQGWCKDCLGNYKDCVANGKCAGYNITEDDNEKDI